MKRRPGVSRFLRFTAGFTNPPTAPRYPAGTVVESPIPRPEDRGETARVGPQLPLLSWYAFCTGTLAGTNAPLLSSPAPDCRPTKKIIYLTYTA